MDNMINVGLNKDAVREARAAINDIIKSNNGENVKTTALHALSTLCSPSLTMTGCTLTSKAK